MQLHPILIDALVADKSLTGVILRRMNKNGNNAIITLPKRILLGQTERVTEPEIIQTQKALDVYRKELQKWKEDSHDDL